MTVILLYSFHLVVLDHTEFHITSGSIRRYTGRSAVFKSCNRQASSSACYEEGRVNWILDFGIRDTKPIGCDRERQEEKRGREKRGEKEKKKKEIPTISRSQFTRVLFFFFLSSWKHANRCFDPGALLHTLT